MNAGRPAVWAALVTVYIVWGSTYLGIRIALRTVPPFLLASSRFLVSGAIVLAIGIALARRAGQPVNLRGSWRGAILPGFLFFALGNGSIAWAEQRVDTGITSLVVCALPLWLALFDRVLYGARLRPTAVAGIVLGFAGAALLAGPGRGHVDVLGVLGISVGSIAWSIGSLRSRQLPQQTHPFVASGVQMLAGAVFLALFGTANGEPWEAGRPSLDAIGGIAYLVVVGTLVGFMLYQWLLRVAPTPLVSTYAFANPVVALLLGWGIENETLSARTLAAAVLIVGAVALIIVSQARAAARGPGAEATGPAATLDA